jgi:type I restriction enzyme S subunit
VTNRWPVARLGDLTELVTKGTTPTSIGHDFTEGGINFVKVESIDTGGRFIKEKLAHITPECNAALGRSQLRDGDILFSIAGALGRTALVTDEILPANTNQALAIIRLRRDVDVLTGFVLKALETSLITEQIEKFRGGAAQQNLSLAQVRDFQIALPPLPEQQRIVTLLDEAFEALATAKANTEQNIKNASALFTSHLKSVFSKRVEEWAEATLGEMCEMYQPKTISTKDLVPDGRYPVFGANGIIGRFDKFNHEEPQLLVTCRGATCGSVNISLPKSWITGNAMVVRPKDNALDLRFLEFIFRGGVDLSVTITGSAQPQITRTNLSPLLIRFPVEISEQIRLAETFQALTAEVKHLTSIYERKLAALEELKTSLLHQAFNGEL